MLPENDPKRVASSRWMRCYNCNSDIPPTIPFYDHSGTAYCQSCHALDAYRPRAAASIEEEFNWPEELEV